MCFGLWKREVAAAIEALDPEHRCEAYWAARAADGQGGQAGADPASENSSSEDESSGGSDEGGGGRGGGAWRELGRHARHVARLEQRGEDAGELEADNPLPDFIDPITMEPVVRPAISPSGHVMGAATWQAVLRKSGTCPFTRQQLSWSQCRLLTHANIELLRDQIKS